MSEAEKRDALIALADRFDSSVGQLVGLMASGSTELEATAQSMSGTAARTNDQAGIVNTAALQASTRVQTVAAAAEELSSSIAEIARQMAQSAKITTHAVDSARRTDTIVRALADGAQQIEHVVELISTDCRPDQPAGAERNDRSRPRRRCRPRLRRRRDRSKEPRRPNRRRHQGDQHPHRADSECDQGSGRRDPGHHCDDRRGQRHRHHDRLRH